MSSELLATYAGLGTHDGEHYYKGEECLACVKDLIRALRADDSRCEIRRELGRARVLHKDLLSILLSSPDDCTLRNDIIRLLVNLTQPAYLCFSESLPKGKDFDSMRCYMEVEEHLRRYKEAFTVESVLNVLGSVLADLCQKDWDHRDDDDIIIIERILLLIRNVLHVSPDPQEEKRTEDDVSVHDQLIWNLHINGIDELLLFLGSSAEETQWCMHVLEIIFLIFREQSPSALAATGRERTAEEKRRDEDLLEEALAKEREKKARAEKIRSARHSRFGGTFVVKNQRSISGSERVYHRQIAGLNSHSYDLEKRPRRTNKNRRPMCDPPGDRLSTFSIRLVLKNMCVQFLECCYNPLMKIVRDNIRRNRSMENDDTYYLWCLRFFMEFCRCHDFRVDIVGETLQLGTFHYLIQLMASYYESMVLEKKDKVVARQWAQRLHYAIQGYHELLQFIHQMSISKDEALCENSKVMLSNVVYHQEYRDVFVSLLRNYNEVVQSRSFLSVLVEATHLYVRMMERYCHGNSRMIVQQKKKKGKPKKSKKRSRGSSTGYVLTQDQTTDLWETIDGRVLELMEGHETLPRAEPAFDAASQEPIEEQIITTMARVRAHLIDANHPEAVALFRAARVFWPEDEGFGREGMTASEEMDVMKSLLFNPAAALPSARIMTNFEDEDDDGEGEEEGEEGGEEVVTYETEFEVRKFVQRFSNNKIVRAYCVVLSNYRNNSSALNHAVVKMLYRIAFELKMAPLLYQISIFRIFQPILQEPDSPRIHELKKFCRHMVAGFFAAAAKNPLIFVELLFWKTSQDVYELTEGYGALERERAKKQLSTVWTREQEEELEELFHRYRNDDDVVACILAGLPQDIPRTRKQVVKQLLSQELIDSSKQLARKPQKRTDEWSEEEVALLREVMESRGEEGGKRRDKEIVQEIATYFPDRGVRNVASKMRELGMLGRKKGGKSGPAVDSDGEAAGDDGGERSRRTRERGREKRKKRVKKKSSRSGGVCNDVPRLVMSLSCRGYEEQLAWLEAYLRDEARDRTVDDEWEEMCIVATGNAVSKMFQEPDFHNLLTALQMQPPSDTEVYWRIPSSVTPGQLESAASSLRPCSILDDTREVESESENEESEQENGELERDNEESESENEERENEESERENEVSRDSDLDCDRKQEVEAAGQEVGGVNEEEVGGGVERGVSPDHTGTASDVELVIDYGDDGEERQEGLRSALLRQLVVKKRERGRERRRRHRHHHETSAVVTEPQPKKPRIARRSEFLASDSDNEEEELTSKGDDTLQLDDGGREEGEKTGLKKNRKLVLDSSDSSSSGTESESDSDSRSSGVMEDQCSGVNLNQDGSDRVGRCQNIATDIQSPVMDTAELLVDTCDPAKHDSSRMTPANTD